MNRRTSFLVGVALIGVTTPSWAAAAAPGGAPADVAASDAAAAAPAQEAAANPSGTTADAPGDIVVTARRRAERLQDVPVAVSAFGAQALAQQQVTDITNLSLAAPSVLITTTGGSANAAQIFIRGFGQDALGYNSETPVAVYYDDVYLGRTQGTVLDTLDVERVEILRGPQGTLYGRNATTGAVKFVPRPPSLDSFRAVAEITGGSYNRLDVRGSLTTPVIEDKLGVKLDVVSRRQDGFVRGVDVSGTPNNFRANGVDRQLVRGALAWQINSGVRVDLSADYSRDRSDPYTGTAITCVAGANSVCQPRYGSPFLTGINFAGQQYYDGWGVTGKFSADLGFSEFKSITAYRGLDALDPIDLADIPGSPSPIIYGQRQDQFSQELQLASSFGGVFDYVAGLYYFNEKWRTNTNFLNLRRNIDEQSADSYAAFGELYIRPIKSLTVTLGGRVTHESKTINRQIFSPLSATTPTVSITPAGYSETVFTPKVAVDFKPVRDLLLYFSWSRGFRPGGYGNTWPGNAIAAAGIFAAEKSESYEFGLKTSLFDDRLTFDFAAYRTNYANLQQGQLTATAFVITSSDVRVQGVEFEATARPFKGLSLFANLGLLDDQVTRSNIPGDNLSRRLRYAPRASFKIGGEYEVPLGGSSNAFFVNGNLSHVSSTAQDQANSLGLIQPGYELVDAQVGVKLASDRYRIAFGGRNLTDAIYWRSGVPGQGRFYAQPRTFAVVVTGKF